MRKTRTSVIPLCSIPLLLLSLQGMASTKAEIEALYNPSGILRPSETTTGDTAARAVAKTPPVARWMRLSNGQQINLADWKVVLFMQGQCPYCHQFDPVLKGISQRTGLSVLAYTIDGNGDAAYPEALPAPEEVMRTFFPGLPVATPTTFLVNVNTLDAWPLLQGATDEGSFMARLDTTFQTIHMEGRKP